MLEPLFNKVAALRPEIFFKRLHHRCFPVSIAKFLRTPVLQNTSERLLLKFVKYLFLGSLFVSLDKSVFGKHYSQNFICLREQKFYFTSICLKTAEVLFSSSFASSFQETIIPMIESVFNNVCYVAK